MNLKKPTYLVWDDRLTAADKNLVGDLNASLTRLSGLRAVEIDVSGKFLRSKIAWKLATYPRSDRFKEDIIQAFYDGINHKPHTTFGNVNADVLADKDPQFQRMSFCSIIRRSRWKG